MRSNKIVTSCDKYDGNFDSTVLYNNLQDFSSTSLFLCYLSFLGLSIWLRVFDIGTLAPQRCLSPLIKKSWVISNWSLVEKLVIEILRN